MSRKLFALLISELTTVRLICKKPQCDGVAELSVEKLGTRSDTTVCPACGVKMLSDDRLPLSKLAKAIQTVQELTEAGSIEVEFVLPDEQVATPAHCLQRRVV